MMLNATKPTLALAIALAVASFSAQAQDRVKKTIAHCVATVRADSDKQAGFKVSQFDAYQMADGGITNFGTARERFEFEKCMDQSGHALKDRKKVE